MALPERTDWLSKEGGPKMILEALKLLGTVEAAGFKRTIRGFLAWTAEVGLAKISIAAVLTQGVRGLVAPPAPHGSGS